VVQWSYVTRDPATAWNFWATWTAVNIVLYFSPDCTHANLKRTHANLKSSGICRGVSVYGRRGFKPPVASTFCAVLSVCFWTNKLIPLWDLINAISCVIIDQYIKCCIIFTALVGVSEADSTGCRSELLWAHLGVHELHGRSHCANTASQELCSVQSQRSPLLLPNFCSPKVGDLACPKREGRIDVHHSTTITFNTTVVSTPVTESGWWCPITNVSSRLICLLQVYFQLFTQATPPRYPHL